MSSADDPPAAPLLRSLEAIAGRAGEIALRHFRNVAAERKADRTIVTEADREVESYLASALAASFPDAGILGEEGSTRAGQGERWFVIDPIDGTSAFVAGLPTWCICIGLMERGAARAGVVHLPVSGETYTAADGSAWWNGTPLARLADAPPAGDPFVAIHSKAHRTHPIAALGKIRALGSAAYHVMLVARGVAWAAVLGDVRIWDLGAAGAVLEAVGGGFALLDGAPFRLADLLDGRRAPGDVIAGTPSAIAEVRRRLAT